MLRSKKDKGTTPCSKMHGAFVFRWKFYWGQDFNVDLGHLSLLLPDGTYISFWPNVNSDWELLRGEVPSKAQKYHEDVEAEGRLPEDIIWIPPKCFNLERIIETWQERKDVSYTLLFRNCATTIKHVLEAGAEFSITSSYLPDPASIFRQIKSGSQACGALDLFSLFEREKFWQLQRKRRMLYRECIRTIRRELKRNRHIDYPSHLDCLSYPASGSFMPYGNTSLWNDIGHFTSISFMAPAALTCLNLCIY